MQSAAKATPAPPARPAVDMVEMALVVVVVGTWENLSDFGHPSQAEKVEKSLGKHGKTHKIWGF